MTDTSDYTLSRTPQLAAPDGATLVMLVPPAADAEPATYALANLANTLLAIARGDDAGSAFADTSLLVAVPADGGSPTWRTWANVRADILAAATTPSADPRVPEWTTGSAYSAGQLVSYHTRVWRCVTDLAVSTTAPTFSSHWMAVGGWSGSWAASRTYTIGNWVTYQGQFYVATQDVAANLDPPPNSPNRWAHLAPDLAGFRGVWVAGGTYYRGDVVWQSEHFYVCVSESVTSNMGPVADTANWDPQGIYHDNWSSTRRYAAGDMVSYGDDDGIWIAPASITAGQPAPGDDGHAWRRVDNDEIEAWAHIGSTARIPRDRLQPPTAGFSGDAVSLRFGLLSVELPVAIVGATPSADRGGTMSAAMVRKLADIAPSATKITSRGEWVGNQRNYGVGDLVHRKIGYHLVLALCHGEHTSSSANGPTGAQSSSGYWTNLLAVPQPDWTADPAHSFAGIRNKPTIPDAHTITTRMLNFDTSGIHSGHGENYWHRSDVLASAVPAGSEVCFELPYTWSPPPRLWSRWPGAPTQVAQEWWLEDYTPPGQTTVVDRVVAPDSSFTTGGSTHYHPMGYIDTESHPRTVETRELALIVDGGGYLCFWTGVRPVVGDHGSTARAAGVRMLWRSM